MLHIGLVTLWGYRAGDLINPIVSEADLTIDPVTFYGILIITFLLIFVATRMLMNRKNLPRVNFAKLTKDPPKFDLKRHIATFMIAILLVFQVSLILYLFYLQPAELQGLPMAESGLSILAFAAATYIYNLASSRNK